MIAVNSSWQLVPHADVLYACDGAWWRAHGGVPGFGGLKIAHDATVCVEFPEITQVHVEQQRDEILTGEPGVIGDGGNSGFQALNLAVQFGASKIVLVGFDMRRDLGVHWHGKHERGLNNPRDEHFAHWRRALDGAAAKLAELGVQVINASPVSALQAYPTMTFPEALRC